MTGFPSFLRLRNIPLCAYASLCLSIRPSMDVEFFLASIVNNTATNRGLQIIYVSTCFQFFAGSYGKSDVQFFEELPFCFPQRLPTPLHSHHRGTRPPITPQSHQHLLPAVLSVIAILMCGKRCLIVVSA